MPTRAPLLLALAAAAGCGVSQELYNARTNELGKVEADLAAARTKLGARDQDMVALRRANDTLRRDLADLDEAKKQLAANLKTTTRQPRRTISSEAPAMCWPALVGSGT